MKLSRAKLYEMVWEKPMTQLAKEFGLSDVGLAKICRKHGIPLPERGYWARVEAGYKPSRKALTRKDYDPEIEIMDREPITEEVLAEKRQKKEKRAEAVASVGVLTVPTELSSPHKLTTMTLRHFEDIQKRLEREARSKNPGSLSWESRAPSSDYGRYHCHSGQGFNITVSLDRMNCALRFLDTLVKALEQRGFRIDNEVLNRKKGRKVLGVTKDGESIRFQLIEGYKQRLRHHRNSRLLEQNTVMPRNGTEPRVVVSHSQ